MQRRAQGDARRGSAVKPTTTTDDQERAEIMRNFAKYELEGAKNNALRTPFSDDYRPPTRPFNPMKVYADPNVERLNFFDTAFPGHHGPQQISDYAVPPGERREEGVWTRRRKIAVFTGLMVNVVFGFARLTGSRG